MSLTPKISLYASAARPQNWLKLYESIKSNECKFEIVFVGPNEPKKKLPDVFRFIKSNTKPVQCAHIAAMHSKGDFLLHCVDDLVFKDDQALDKMLSLYEDNKGASKELILSPKLMRDGKPYDEDNYKLYPENEDCPVIPISLFIKKALFVELEGYDLNFIASMADTDLSYRAKATKGATIELADLFVEESKDESLGGTLFSDYSDNDLTLLRNLWFKDGLFLNNRSQTFEGFSSEGIIINTQGNPGRWKVTNNLMARFVTSELFYRLKNIFKRLRTFFRL